MARNRRGGNRVCRRDDGPEYKAQPPIEAPEDDRHNQSHRADGECNQTKSQEQNADKVVAKVAPGSSPGREIEQGRQNHEKDKIGIQGEVRDAGKKPESQAAKHHNDRIRRSESACENPENNDEKQQKKKNQLDLPDFIHVMCPVEFYLGLTRVQRSVNSIVSKNAIPSTIFPSRILMYQV